MRSAVRRVSAPRPTVRVTALTFVFMALVASSTIVWVRVVQTDVAYLSLYHLLGLATLGLVFLQHMALRNARILIGSAWQVWGATVLLLMTTAYALTRSAETFTMGDLTRQSVYVAISFASGMAVLTLHRAGQLHHLRWLPPLTLATFMLFVVWSVAGQGLDPLGLLMEAARAGDPDRFMFPVFGSLLRSGNIDAEDVRVSMRHDIMYAMIVATYLGLLIMTVWPARSGWVKLIVYGSMIGLFVIVLFSLSRAAWLAMFLGGLLFAIWQLSAARRMAVAAIVASYGLTLLAVVAVTTPVFTLILDRLLQTKSYEGRSEYAAYRWQVIGDHPITGTPYFLGVNTWAHNLVLDYWSALGIIGLVVSALMVFVLAAMIVRTARQSLLVRSNLGLAYVLCGGLLCLPFTRLFTAPKGHFSVTPWMAIGLSAAFIVVLRSYRQQVAESPPPQAKRAAPMMARGVRGRPATASRLA